MQGRMTDDDLKGAFRALRQSDAECAPGFDLGRKPRPRKPRVALVLAPSFAVLASAAAILLWIGRANAPPQASAPVVAAAAQPTILEPEPLGFLLDVPDIGSPDFDSDPTGKRP